MKIYVLCVAVRNREGGRFLCRGPGARFQGDCTKVVLGKRAGAIAPTVGCRPY